MAIDLHRLLAYIKEAIAIRCFKTHLIKIETANMEIQEISSCEALPLLSLNHVSLLVKSVKDSANFYEQVLGFVLVKRPSSFDFHGAWLYNYGMGIHLLENEAIQDYGSSVNKSRPINPKDNHISFQCTDVDLVKMRLKEMGLKYVSAVVEDEGIKVDQVFFHDPDGYMIEICNCDNLPVLPIFSCPLKPRFGNATTTAVAKAATSTTTTGMNYWKQMGASKCGHLETFMMESLSLEMLNFSF